MSKRLRNTLSVRFYQDTTKPVKKSDVVVEKPVKHQVTFTTSTNSAIDSAGFSDWMQNQLLRYQMLQKLQGKKDRFDTALPIMMEISVNDKSAAASIAFSTNPTTLKRRLEQYPNVINAVMNPENSVYGTEREKILEFAKGVSLQLAEPGSTIDEINEELEAEKAEGQPLITDSELVVD